MEQSSGVLIRCGKSNKPRYRIDDQGRGLWLWCNGAHCHKEELATWDEMKIPRRALEELLSKYTAQEAKAG